MFSVAWPLAGCFFLINNGVELRSDGLKIAISCKRPIPWRSDSIGPWISAIGFLSWLGSVTSAAIIYLCSGTQEVRRGPAAQATAWGGLLCIILAEHFYLLTQLVVRFVMSKFESRGLQKERKERYLTKKKLLAENAGQQAASKASVPGIESTEKVTRAALEEEAREASIRGHGTAEQLYVCSLTRFEMMNCSEFRLRMLQILAASAKHG